MESTEMSTANANTTADMLVAQGLAWWQAGHAQQAIGLFRQAECLAPGHAAARSMLGQALFQQGAALAQTGAHASAIAILREAERLQPGQGEVARALGVALLGQASQDIQEGRTEQAEAGLREAERLLPEEGAVRQLLVQLLVRKAILQAQAERPHEAAGLLREGLRLAAGDLGVVFLYSRLAFEAGWTEEAAMLARRLVAESPDQAAYAGWACLALHAAGDAAAAAAQALRFVDMLKSGRQVAEINPNEVLRILGEVLIAGRQHEQAIALFSGLSQSGFHPAVCATVIADALLDRGAVEQALAVISPFAASTWSRTFVTASIAQFRETLRRAAAELPPRRIGSHDPAHAVSMSSLASYGRFGQQMCEYLLGYFYAQRNGLVLETPDWVGHYFFELDEPLLPPYRHVVRKGQRAQLRRNLQGQGDAVIANADIWSPGGPWNDDWRPGAPMLPVAMREAVQQRLKVRPQWMPWLQPALDRLRSLGNTIVAIHLRRGDRVAMNDITRTALYLDWLEQVWPTLDRPVLFIASDDIEMVKQDFSRYRPYSLDDLAEPWRNNEYLQDFFILMNCDILGISTGGFAASAALLNRRARLFVCPAQDNRGVVAFEPYVA